MGDVERLRDVVKPPSEELVPFREWSELECRLGVAVPPDYRQLVATFGPGVFDEFIHIQQPKSRFEAIRLVSFSLAYRKRLFAQRESGRDLPYDPEDLLPVARTEDGDVICWVMQPVDSPARWSLIVSNAGRSEWIDFSGGISKFLTAVFLEGFRIPFFPPDFPSNHPTFYTYPSVEELQQIFPESSAGT
jgi:hypothetical protein